MGIKSRYERIEKMKTLIEELNNASIAYYTSTPIMSDYDWDKKYEELQMLENQENIIFPWPLRYNNKVFIHRSTEALCREPCLHNSCGQRKRDSFILGSAFFREELL